MTQWTDEQLRAIEARSSHILLSAAAGSGKTTVLVERVLRLVTEEGVDVDRMLVVTFTRAAASDMRAKLSRRLNERAAEGDERCRDQLLKLDRASISTLHAFCADFLRTHFEIAGVDPAFRILDDSLSARLREEALIQALEEAYGAGGEDLLELDYGRGPGGVRAALEALFTRLEDRPDPEAWLERASRCDDAAVAAWVEELVRAKQRALRSALAYLWQALGVPGCPAHFDRVIRQDIVALEALLNIDEYDALSRAVAGFDFVRASGGRGASCDPDALEAVKKLRESAKAILRAESQKALALSVVIPDARRLSGQFATLSRIALRTRELFEAGKAEQSGLMYADLEHRTLRALQNPEVARQLRERYEYVFVDEYQDTSDLQEALVQALCRRDNLFMVGDVKQSIYRFRQAEPGLFLEKYRCYQRGEGGALLPLTCNFRSRPDLLAFVNMVFERCMTGGDSEIAYDENARLHPGLEAEDGAPAVSIRLIEGAPPEEDEAQEEVGETLRRLGDMEREAALIAGEIRRMMAEDPGLRYRDFAILSRSKAAPFAALMPVMLSQGIPAYADGQTGYYESMEIMWLMALLRLAANRRSDVELIAILHSPVVGLSAEELARIRVYSPELAYVDAAARYAEENDDAVAERVGRFFEQLAGWRLRSGSLGLGELVRLMLEDTGFYTYVGALPGGPQRQANLDMFVAAAAGFDDEYSGSLTRFLQYTEHLRQKGDGDAAHLLGENDDVVRMMTIHKSKGLEFPVVFGVRMSRRYRKEKSNAPLVTHRDLGMGMAYVDPELRTRRQSLPMAAIMARMEREDAAEEMRILYVLLTRAQKRLILVGSVEDVGKAMRRWEALSAALFSAKSHLDLIMAARCGAEAAGEPTWSELTVIPKDRIALPEGEGGPDSPRSRFEEIMAHPERYASEELQRQMAWRYPDPASARKPLKLTASGLLRELEGPDELPPLLERPQFMSEDARRMTGAERGTAYHRAMQLLDLEALAGLSGRALANAVDRQLDDCANRRLMTDAQRQAVFAPRLCRFLESEWGLKLRAAKLVRREWSFNVMLRADEALTEGEARGFDREELLVQGTIDCCFEENGAWVLLDYKTDRADDMDALRRHYAAQLRLYALALERITGMPVARKGLALLSTGEILEI